MKKDYTVVQDLAYEFLIQGIWDQEDLARFVLDQCRRAHDRGYQQKAGGLPSPRHDPYLRSSI